MAETNSDIVREIIRDVALKIQVGGFFLPDGPIEQEMIERYNRRLDQIMDNVRREAENREHRRHERD